MFINFILVLFIISWLVFGLWMVVKSAVWFGPDRDNPSETPSARELGNVHVISMWFGVLALAVYFLFR